MYNSYHFQLSTIASGCIFLYVVVIRQEPIVSDPVPAIGGGIGAGIVVLILILIVVFVLR